MQLQSDHKALIFIGAIAVLGAGVRITRAAAPTAAQTQPALDQQMQSADSAKRAAGGKRRTAKPGAQRAQPAAASPGSAASSVAAVATPDHVGGRIDVDVANAAQLDSLPGVGPTLARRIVLERIAHGPFHDILGLRRRTHLSAKTAAQLDSLVIFSGVIAPSSPADTIIPKTSRAPSVKSPS